MTEPGERRTVGISKLVARFCQPVLFEHRVMSAGCENSGWGVESDKWLYANIAVTTMFLSYCNKCFIGALVIRLRRESVN